MNCTINKRFTKIKTSCVEIEKVSKNEISVKVKPEVKDSVKKANVQLELW